MLAQKLLKIYVSLEFKTSKADPCLSIQQELKEKLLVALYEDGLIAATHEEDLINSINQLKTDSKFSKLESYFL